MRLCRSAPEREKSLEATTFLKLTDPTGTEAKPVTSCNPAQRGSQRRRRSVCSRSRRENDETTCDGIPRVSDVYQHIVAKSRYPKTVNQGSTLPTRFPVARKSAIPRSSLDLRFQVFATSRDGLPNTPLRLGPLEHLFFTRLQPLFTLTKHVVVP